MECSYTKKSLKKAPSIYGIPENTGVELYTIKNALTAADSAK